MKIDNVARAKSIELTAEQGELLQKWYAADGQLTSLKAIEFELRQRVVKELKFDPKKLEGTETLEIGNGWKLRVQKTQNYTLTNANGETVELLNAIGTTRPDLAQQLVTWKPDMSKTAYKLLLEKETLAKLNEGRDEANRVDFLLAKALTIKPGAPQVELIPPEAKVTE